MEIREVLEKIYYPERGIRKRVMWLEECLGRCDVVSEVLSECVYGSCSLLNYEENSEFIIFMFSHLYVRVDKRRRCVYYSWFGSFATRFT